MCRGSSNSTELCVFLVEEQLELQQIQSGSWGAHRTAPIQSWQQTWLPSWQ